jgi:uncharacterized protein involved in response to NO
MGIGHWLFYSIGWLPTYSVYFHSFLQVHVYLGCFVAGFLFTSIPRFSGAHHANVVEVLSMMVILISIFTFLALGIWLGASISYLAFLISIGRFIITRFRKEMASKEPAEFVWLPMGILHGIIGTLIYIAARLRWTPVWMFEVGEEMTELGFILCAVLGIGGFLGPRLMGRQKLFIRPMKGNTLERIAFVRKKRMAIHFIAGLVLFSSFWLEGLEKRVLGFSLRAAVITFEFIWTGSLPFPPRTQGLHAKLLWISIWMVALGSWALALFPDQEKAMLHIIFIGGFSLMIFAVATVVVLSHCGEAARLEHKIWALRIILLSIIFALIFRVSAAYFPEYYFSILAHASGLWLLAGLIWFIFALPKVVTIPANPEKEDAPCQTDE